MPRVVIIFLILLILLAECYCQRNNNSYETDRPVISNKYNLIRYVNPFIGTDGHGHTYPGATLPFGMVQLSPDTRLEGWDGCSGYHYSDSVVYGFSHTHLSGTGVADYCDILIMPTIGEIKLFNGSENPDSGYASRFNHENEKASPGFYSTYLDDYGIQVELTATKRAGFHKYRFPASKQSNIIIDLQHRDPVIESWLNVVSDTEIEGYRRSSSWAKDQRLYFVAKFSKPFVKYGVAENDSLIAGKRAEGLNVKAFVRYKTKANEEILVKVGISAVSVEGARKNLNADIPHWNFNQIKRNAENDWNRELSRIIVEGGTEAQKRTFYTALYHAFLAPNLFTDVDGSYRGRDLNIHKADGFDYCTVFSLWDTFRGAHPLFTIVQQKRTIDFIKTMIAQYRQGGRLPVWELAANETECMIGYHSIPVIADAYIKGLRDFNINKAYEAMKHSSESGLFGLGAYQKYGFIPGQKEAESVSKTLEYAYDDWCIAQVARKLGKEEDYKYYIKRAQNYKNLFDPCTGFMRARINGRWFSPFDPKEVNFNYTEANAWQYSFFVPHDINNLIALIGGKKSFESRLDQLFTEDSQTTGRGQADITGLIGQYAHGNEPSHHMAYLYNYIAKPWKTQKLVRQIMDNLYNDKPDGLCGNEDCGQMSAWYVLSALGFYPVTPGDGTYAIGTPLFEKSTIFLENGKTFVINANDVSNENIYIHSAKLNEPDYNKSWVAHSTIMDGGNLYFNMSAKPNMKWASAEENLPLSEIRDYPIVTAPVLKSGQRTFMDSTIVELETITPGAAIYFTLDGSEPDIRSKIYKTPLVIKNTGTLKSFSYKNDFPKSGTIEAKFSKLPKNRSIRLYSEYANQYSVGGDFALIDGICGGMDFRTGAWQGYQGADLTAIVDLGEAKRINQISTGFLQDINSWIFMPYEVEYFTSVNGKDFKSIAIVKNKISHKLWGAKIQQFNSKLSVEARFIKMVARNIGLCPEWHKGAGHKAWIFADEITIEQESL